MPESRKTVLVVEDDEAERDGLAVLLHRAGYVVAMVANGREALEHLQVHPPPDLILTGMLMPILDGWGLLEELRRLPGVSMVPVVIITGSMAIGQDWVKAHGCVACIHKPLNTERLLRVVRQTLEAKTDAFL
jgi:CheY-like chemotaxis protein